MRKPIEFNVSAGRIQIAAGPHPDKDRESARDAARVLVSAHGTNDNLQVVLPLASTANPICDMADSTPQSEFDQRRDALVQQLESRRPDLTRFVASLLGPGLRGKIEPDDIIQEVGAYVYANAGEVDTGDQDPFGWFCQVARRKVMDAARHFQALKRDARRESAMHAAPDATAGGLERVLAASITTPTRAFSRREKEQCLLEALRQLPEEQNQALTLRYLQNLSSREIAKRIGKSDGATRVLLTRALKRLEQIMRQSHPDWTIAQPVHKET